MLNLKKWMTKVSNALYVGNTEYTPTYISNSYCSTTAVNRLRVFRTGPRSGLVRINLSNDLAAIPSTDNTEHEIASFSGISFARDAYIILPSQNVGTNESTLYVFLTGNKIKIANFSGATIIRGTFFRLNVPVVLNLDTGGVISYLIHLTGLLKSFCGRRWAYAEPQEDVDEDVERFNSSENNLYTGGWDELFRLRRLLLRENGTSHACPSGTIRTHSKYTAYRVQSSAVDKASNCNLCRWANRFSFVNLQSRCKLERLRNRAVTVDLLLSGCNLYDLTLIPREGVMAC